MAYYYGLTEEESELIKAAIVLPMVLKVVEKCKRDVENEKIVMKQVYLITTDVLITRIRTEIARVKKELYKNQIKVIGPSPAEPLGYAFAARGLSNNLVMSREEARREIGNRLGVFVGRISSDFGKQGTVD